MSFDIVQTNCFREDNRFSSLVTTSRVSLSSAAIAATNNIAMMQVTTILVVCLKLLLFHNAHRPTGKKSHSNIMTNALLSLHAGFGLLVSTVTDCDSSTASLAWHSLHICSPLNSQLSSKFPMVLSQFPHCFILSPHKNFACAKAHPTVTSFCLAFCS